MSSASAARCSTSSAPTGIRSKAIRSTTLIGNTAILGKLDALLNPSNTFNASYNFDYSKNDKPDLRCGTYGNSSNGIEGPSKINVANLNLFTTISPNKLNELHVTYAKELRPRNAISSNVPTDTGMGDPAFRFGNPFFLQPNVDELLWRTQIKNNLSIVSGNHTFKVGGEWLHPQRSGLSWLFHRPLSIQHGERVHALRLIGGPGGFGRTRWPARTARGSPTRRPVRPAAHWLARLCCCSSRSREPVSPMSIRPASRARQRGPGAFRSRPMASVRTSPSTTACAGTLS